jgi:hypothetical protein
VGGEARAQQMTLDETRSSERAEEGGTSQDTVDGFSNLRIDAVDERIGVEVRRERRVVQQQLQLVQLRCKRKQKQKGTHRSLR